jgi:hypothetical protein
MLPRRERSERRGSSRSHAEGDAATAVLGIELVEQAFDVHGEPSRGADRGQRDEGDDGSGGGHDGGVA